MSAVDIAKEIIKKWEKLVLHAYDDGTGTQTIGYGHTEDVEQGDKTTEYQADKWLEQDMENSILAVNKMVKADLNDNQKAAMISFVFNVGSGNLAKSTLLEKLNQGKIKEAAKEFPKWVYSKGKRSRGLERRRLEEQKLFNTPVGNGSCPL